MAHAPELSSPATAPNRCSFGQLDPMVSAAAGELAEAGIFRESLSLVGIGATAARFHVLAGDQSAKSAENDDGRRPFLESRRVIEPAFAEIKQNRRAGLFKRRGRAAVRSEWA
jgi:hypothetical protein